MSEPSGRPVTAQEATAETGVWKPGDYAWVQISQGRPPVIMQRGHHRNWFTTGNETPYYAGDIWDIVAAVPEPAVQGQAHTERSE